MWARVMEFALACWLALSPFIFRYEDEGYGLMANDLVCALLIMTMAFLSFWRPLEKAHFMIIPVALWLMGLAFFHESAPPPPPYQNYVFVSIILIVLAIIPNYASAPPRSWAEYSENRKQKGDY